MPNISNFEHIITSGGGTSISSILERPDLLGLLSPGLIGSIIGGGGASGGSGASGGAATQPGDLSTLLGDIPIANDGNVFTAHYHNSLRAALIAFAGYLGQLNRNAVEVVAPALQPDAWQETGDWRIRADRAMAYFAQVNKVSGWVALDLPDGAKLQTLTIVNQRGRGLGTLTVELRRLPLASPEATTPDVLARFTGKPDDADIIHSHNDQVQVNAPDSSGNVDALVTVDNSSYRYVIVAQADGSETAWVTEIFNFQLAYTRW